MAGSENFSRRAAGADASVEEPTLRREVLRGQMCALTEINIKGAARWRVPNS